MGVEEFWIAEGGFRGDTDTDPKVFMPSVSVGGTVVGDEDISAEPCSIDLKVIGHQWVLSAECWACASGEKMREKKDATNPILWRLHYFWDTNTIDGYTLA